MTRWLSYKIFFMGGALSAREHVVLYDKYRPLLQKMVPARAGKFPIHFEPIEFCSREKFVELLTNPSTVGIFWYGHGRPSGVALTNEGYKKPRKTLNPIALAKELKLARHSVSPNLQFLALITCHSQRYSKEWRKMLPVATKLKTFEGKVISAGGETRGHVTRWITKFGDRPDAGARNMLHYAKERLTKLQPVPGLYSGTVPGLTTKTAPWTSSRAPATKSAVTPGSQGMPWYWQRGRGGKMQMRYGIQKQKRIITPKPPPAGLRTRGHKPKSYIHRGGAGLSTGIGVSTGAGKHGLTSGLAKLRKSTALEGWLKKQRALAGAKQKKGAAQFRRRWVKPGKTKLPHRVIQPGYYWLHHAGGRRKLQIVKRWKTTPTYW